MLVVQTCTVIMYKITKVDLKIESSNEEFNFLVVAAIAPGNPFKPCLEKLL